MIDEQSLVGNHQTYHGKSREIKIARSCQASITFFLQISSKIIKKGSQVSRKIYHITRRRIINRMSSNISSIFVTFLKFFFFKKIRLQLRMKDPASPDCVSNQNGQIFSFPSIIYKDIHVHIEKIKSLQPFLGFKHQMTA